MINLSFFSAQAPLKSEASGSWSVALVSAQQSWKGWDRMICQLGWTFSADTRSSSTSPSAPPSKATSGGSYREPAGEERDMGMQWRGEGREAQLQGRVGYSQQAGATTSKMWLKLGSKGWYNKVNGQDWSDAGFGTVCDAQSPPPQYVFSLARASLFPLPTMLFKACYSKSQHAIKDVTMRRLVGVCACVFALREKLLCALC